MTKKSTPKDEMPPKNVHVPLVDKNLLKSNFLLDSTDLG